MAQDRMDLSTFVGKLLSEQDADVLHEGVQVLAQALMEAEVSTQVGAGRYERSEARTAYRNGYRTRAWDTRVGTIELRIPKVSKGSYFPSLLEPRRRAEQALACVVQEAYVHGVSTRKVDDLVQALGIDGISKSQVSRICRELDGQVEAFRSRPISGEHPYLWLDATFHKVREDGRVVSAATVVAVGVSTTGERQVLGVDCGPAEDHAFWKRLLRDLVRRWLTGFRLLVSDAREGLKAANHRGHGVLGALIAEVLDGVATTTGSSPSSATSPDPYRIGSRKPRRSSPRPLRICWPTCTSPRPTAAGCAPRTPLSGSTRRSSAARTSWGSSRTASPCCGSSGCSSPSRTTSGLSPTAATSASSR